MDAASGQARKEEAASGTPVHYEQTVRERVAAGLGPGPRRADLERGAPLVLQDVQADAAQGVYVRVVDLRQEANLQQSRREWEWGLG
jgi:hypothetical protein